ncbi:MAG: DNA internalization-related competence protein ComEC/Rec2 [Gammaproteobacteria bacterium]|nr:DNA internalization-related competence protein ComEC/Rec2 [Gammaproteobacteria bacterium]
MLAGMLAVATGIVATTRLGSLPGAAPLIAALPLLVPLLFSTRAALRTGGCLLLGLALGMLRGHEMLARALPAELEGQDLAVRVCVEGLPERFLDVRGERWRFRARVLDALPGARGAWAARQGRRVELSWYGAGDFRPGDAWSMTVRLRAPRGFVNPGGRDYQAWLLAEGIDASGYVVGKAPHARLAARGCGAHLDRLRWSLRTRLAELVGNEPQFGKLLAVTIGDDSRFRPSDWEVFALTGTTHLMVISGMHITLVAMLALLGAKRVLRLWPGLHGRVPAQSAAIWAAFPCALLYGGLAGWSVSVQRALLMLAVVFVFGVAERHLRAWLAFGCALLLVLVLQPMAALQTGFWLSFLAVAALIFVFSGRVRRPTRLQLLWQPQLVIAIALAGPLLLAGQPQAILAPLVNALAIPLVDLVVVPCALLGCLLLPLGDVLAWPLLRMALLALDLLWWLLAHAASWNPPLPEGGGVSVETWRVLLALGGTIWLLLPRGFPARAIGLVLMLPLLLPARAAPSMLELWVLDVGQGSAVIVRTREHTLVYDTGARFSERFDAGRAIVAPALRNTGDPRVDLLLISHADGDHAGGAAGLMDALPVREVRGGEPVAGIELAPCERGQHWSWDGVDFELLHPPPGSSGTRDNDRSCVLRVSAAGHRFLLAGDIEALAEAELLRQDAQALRAEVLLVPHHGSRSSSTAAFVAAVAPRYALVSAGYRNRFGHPHPAVVERYAARGTQLLNTAYEGAIRMRVAEDGSLEQPVGWRSHRPRFWYAQPGGAPD